MTTLYDVLGGDFVASENENSDFELLPDGDYTLQITNAEIVNVKNNGAQLVFTMQVVGGQYDGRQVKERLNVKNNNPEAVKVSLGKLSTIIRVCGFERIKLETELVGKKFVGHVAIKKGEGTYIKDGVEKPSADQNVIKKYMPVSGVAKTVAPAAQAATPADTGAKKMPWAK